MNQPSRLLAAASAAFALVACSGGGGGSSDGGGGGGGSPLTATASSSSIRADGVATVTIHVDGGEAGSVSVSTSRGVFDGNVTSLTMPATPFDLVLYTCDSRLDRSCAGLATVTVLDKALARRSVTIQLKQLEICNNNLDDNGDGKVDCADADCPEATACSAYGKTCGADAKCSVCSGNGGAPQLAEASCDDGFDNDCDGKSDCEDSDCGGKVCQGAVTADGKGVTTGACNTTSKTCVCTPKPEVCNDGLDNDCDGKIDCDDLDCQPKAGAAGQVCDAQGHTCSPVGLFTPGKSECGKVCSGNGGAVQPLGAEEDCFDGKDNDCNGLADCQDPHCAEGGFACGMNGQICSAAQLACVCGQNEPTGEQTCDDRVDNDCDGKVDCADDSCKVGAKSCGPNNMRCTASGTCACSPPSGVAQTKESTCTDGVDNDCDGFVDCQDPDCRPTSAGKYGLACGTTNQAMYGFKCDFTGQCSCSNGALTETSCSDTVDNDCNGLADCFDVAACAGKPCGLNGLTCNSSQACVCGGNGGAAEPGLEVTCDDGKDNDCDGKADCDDPDCAGKACNTSFAAYVCKPTGTSGYTCRDSSGYALTLVAASTRIPADGIATTTLTATLTKDNGSGTFVGQNGETISFSTTSGWITSSATTAGTSPNSGKATATFTSDPLGGPAEIVATFQPDPLISPNPVVATVTIDQPRIGQVKLVSVQYPILGVRSSGFQETDQLTFQVLDADLKPYPAGLDVTFTHQNLGGGSYVGSVPACDGANLCTATAKTTADGKASVTLHSGTAYNVVQVQAGAQAGNVSASAVASNLAIVGAKASGSHLSVTCSPRNVPAFFSHDCSYSTYAGPDSDITCWVGVQDRFNNVLGVASLVNFRSEAGAAGPPATTPMYDTSKQPGTQTALGTASDYITVTNAALPMDVEPWASERWADASLYGGGACPKATYNPRDGLSTVVVFMNGEEGFVDQNANGEYDPGEPFIDMGEPFVDRNDNGICDPGEQIQDVNVPGNTPGVCDGPNGQWDRDTVIWAETRVTFSGLPDVLITGSPGSSQEHLSRFFDLIPDVAGVVPNATPTPYFVVTAKKAGPPVVDPTTYDIGLFWSDVNLNPPSYSTKYALAKTGDVAVAFTQSPAIIDNLGMSFTRMLCDSPTPVDRSSAHCSNTCNWPRCYYVTDVGGFSYGTWGTVRITGGSKPDTDVVTVTGTATLNNVLRKVTVNGENR